MYSAKILLDSMAPSGARLTTWELTYPRFVHAELMTHRQFSRNSASSRAIPTEKLLARIENDPAMPQWWGKNQPGMQAKEELSGEQIEEVKRLWLEGRDYAVNLARKLAEKGLHKQIANRVVEPWMFITVILSATEFDNFYALRCHPDAQPEIRWVADEMRRLHESNTPTLLQAGDWHMPLLREEDFDDPSLSSNHAERMRQLIRISVGRCARVSYLTHDGRRALDEDLGLCDRLIASGHMSPTEHVAMALNGTQSDVWFGNFRGWMQYRKTLPNEAVFKPR